MNKTLRNTTGCTAVLALALALTACAPLVRKAPPPGAPLAEVTARLGQPNAVYPEPGGGQVLEYRGQPMGQFQHMARIGPDGRLLSYEQVLTNENFEKIEIGSWSKDDVLRHFGRPAEVMPDRLEEGEIWSYRYKDKGLWNSFMNVTFNRRGAVLRTGTTADPLFDDRTRGF
jgi:hypothetical protein